MYDVIVLGATFAAAGIAQTLGDKCLIIERRPQAGYEFISALNFGTNYEKKLQSDEAKDLQKIFEERNVWTENRVSLFECSAPLYRLLEGKNVLLNTEIISVEKAENHFVCSTHGVSGQRKFEAKKIIDTRCKESMCDSKTYNLLMDGDASIDYNVKKWGMEQNYVLRCEVPLDADYPKARKIATEILKKLPDSHKLVLLADTFDYQVKNGYPKTENSVVYMPSKGYENPLLAFDAGVCLGKELADVSF